MAGEATVGSIVGYLRLDRSQWSAEINAARGQATELGRTNPNIHISTNAAEALTQLELVAAASKRLQDAQGRVAVAQQKVNDLEAAGNAPASKLAAAHAALARSTRDVELSQIRLAKAFETVNVGMDASEQKAKKLNASFSPLMTSIVALGPALIPLGAAAVSALGSATVGVGALALAFLGAKDAMKAGTPLGQEYAASLAGLNGVFVQLKQSAASAALPAFNSVVAQSIAILPNLTGEISKFASVGGDIVDHLLHGLIGGFVTLEPLFTMIANGADTVAAGFDKWANGTGLQSFQAWMIANLPQIASAVAAIAKAIASVTVASSDMGLIGVQAMQFISDAINAIPTGVLKILVEVIAAGYLAFKAWVALTAVVETITKITAALKAYTAAQIAASAAQRGGAGASAFGALATSGSVALGAVAALTVGLGLGAKAFANYLDGGKITLQLLDHAKDIIGDLTQAVIDDAGAWGDTTRAHVSAMLQSDGLSDRLKKQGISLAEVTDAVESNDDSFMATIETWKKAGQISDDTYLALVGVHNGLQKSTVAANDWLSTQLKANSAASTGASSLQELRDAFAGIGSAAGGAAAQQTADFAAAQNAVADAFHISVSQGDQYATTAGWVNDTSLTGAENGRKYALAVSGIAAANRVANTSAQGLLTAMQAFSTSAGGAADRAALLGAVLRTSQGDALSYGGAIAAGYGAINQLISTFQQQAADTISTSGTVNAGAQAAAIDKVAAATSRLNAAQIKQGDAGSNPATTAAQAASAAAAVASAQSALTTANNALDKASQAVGGKSASVAFADTERAAIDLETGLINLKATGAAPLIQQLQGMQDAAVNSAQALFQHELAAKGMDASLSDAKTLFISLTHGALVDNAKQLGLTGDQAKKLADQYFAIPDDLDFSVHAVGLTDINDTLDKIGQLLAAATGQTWPIKVDADTQKAQTTVEGFLVHIATLQTDTQIGADILSAQATVAGFLQQIAQLDPTVRVQADISAAQFQIGSLIAQIGQLPNGRIPGNAGGGDVPEGYSWAGENGAELLYKSGGNVHVFNNAQSMAMESSGTVPGPGIGSPAAASVKASYSTPSAPGIAAGASANNSVPLRVELTTNVLLDRQIVGQSVAEYNLDAARG